MVSLKYPGLSCKCILTQVTGFAVAGEYGDAAIQDAQATAYDQMLKWIKEH